MTKEFENLLEDFKIIKMKTINAGYNYGFKVWDEIEQALLELKQIKEAKPSEALDKLEGLGFGLWNEDKSIISINGHYFKNAYDIIKQASLKAQEQEEALRLVSQYLSFEYGGTAIFKDFINGTQEMKHIIKVKSKYTGATINVPLDNKQEFYTLKEWLE